jgi:hypothetical protein
VEVSFGLGQQDFTGNVADPSTGAVGSSNGPFNVESESMKLRVGYTRELGDARRVALTPFFGLAQQAWLRGDTTYSGSTVYWHYAAEIGLLGQVTVTPKLVLGADASLGHTIGAWQIDQRDLIKPNGGITSSVALYLDNRTSNDWHQRLIVRQSWIRYGEPAQSVGSFEPRRNSALSVQLEFGTELDLFETLFH